MRMRCVRVAMVVVFATIGGCGGAATSTSPSTGGTYGSTVDDSVAAPAAPSETSVAGAATIEPGVTSTAAADNGGMAIEALTPETDAERAAIDVAASDVGRGWAEGDPNASARAAGDPFLVGYNVLAHDGVTQYQVSIINGRAVPMSSPLGTMVIEGPYYEPNFGPADTARQTAAIDVALATISAVNPGATTAGISSYIVYFPSVGANPMAGANNEYPSVAVYANPLDPVYGQFAMGGHEFR